MVDMLECRRCAFAEDFWLLVVASRHFRVDTLNLVGMVDKMDIVDNVNVVDKVNMVDGINIANIQKTFGYLKVVGGI